MYAQVRLMWEKWEAVGSVWSMDVTPDGRYLVLLERMSGGDVLIVRDNTDNSMRGYHLGDYYNFREMRIRNGSTVRVADRDGMREFDLNTRQWHPRVTNDLRITSVCKDQGGIVDMSPDLSYLLFTNHLCIPARARLLRYDDMQVVKDWTIPDVLTRVSQGRTADEFIYYNEKEVGLTESKRISFPDVYLVSDVMTLYGQVYVVYKSNDKMHHLCRIDPDNATVLAQADIVSTDNQVRIVPGPSADRIHIYGGRISMQFDAITLASLGSTAVRTGRPMIRLGSDYLINTGGVIYRTPDPMLLGEVYHATSEATLELQQDHRGRVLAYNDIFDQDDSLVVLDPHTGAKQIAIPIPSPPVFNGGWSYVITDPNTDRIALCYSNEIRILEGDHFEREALHIGLSLPTEQSEQGDTAWRFDGALSFPSDTEQARVRLSYNMGYPMPIGMATATCDAPIAGKCSITKANINARYTMWPEDSVVTQAIELRTTSGIQGTLVSDTTVIHNNLFRVRPDRYLLPNDNGFAIVDRLANVTSSIITAGSTSPRAVCEARNLLCGWRTTDSSVVLIDLETGAELWSAHSIVAPKKVLLDRNGTWLIVSNPGGQTLGYDISNITSVVAPSQPLTIRPNPASDHAIIDVADGASWSLVDAFGRECLHGTSKTISLDNVASGVYFVRVYSSMSYDVTEDSHYLAPVRTVILNVRR